MSYAQPTISDIDVQLREVAEMRALLTGLNDCINQMHVVLTKREQSLRACREELTAHLAEIAARAAEQQRAGA